MISMLSLTAFFISSEGFSASMQVVMEYDRALINPGIMRSTDHKITFAKMYKNDKSP